MAKTKGKPCVCVCVCAHIKRIKKKGKNFWVKGRQRNIKQNRTERDEDDNKQSSGVIT